jgi:EAL domain-containing protein (putative c-di-GMP-specific phosphodiesterase class I)/DNA-binding NarL/FixJ family response regulator
MNSDFELHPLIRARGIMVVEDSHLQRRAAVETLQQFGISVIHEAASGEEALDSIAILSIKPAVLLLDLELPGIDGIEVVQELAQGSIKPAIIVLSSADSMLLNAVSTMIMAFNLPFLGALRKPVNATDLRIALARYQHLNKHMTNQAIADGNNSITSTDLSEAITSHRIKPFYQPKIGLAGGTIDGVEVLARWISEPGRVISPAMFIPLAEQCGLICNLTMDLIDQVIVDQIQLQQDGIELPLAINLSASSLAHPSLANEVMRRFHDANIATRNITFEITESALVNDLPFALATINRLRLRGFGFAIDDYGTGFSSLQQLSRFPFTELKIDRSFIHGAPHRESLRAILQSAIDTGHRLGINTVAEGIETEEELMLVKALGCHQAQGFLMAKPMAGQELARWIQNHQHRIADLCAQTQPLEVGRF